MQPTPLPSPFPTAWIEVLENVQEALVESDAEAARREERLANAFLQDDAEVDREASADQRLEQLKTPFHDLQAGAEQAGQHAAGADTALEAAEVLLRQWLAAAEAAGRKLADWTAP